MTAHLKEFENRLKIDYVITDAITNKRITKATTTQVAVEITTKEMQFASPAVIVDKLAKILS